MTDSNGLYYMRARFYNPEIRRFVNQDVLLGNVNEGQTLNRYAYVTGRPVSFVDPFGLAQEDVNRAIDIMKVFLPCIYNNEATVTLGNPFKWWNPRHWWIVLNGGLIEGYAVDGSITIDERIFGGVLYPYRRISIYDDEGSIIGYRRGKPNQVAIDTLHDLLEVIIHEYQHTNHIGSHAHVYATSKLLSGLLLEYMLLENAQWEKIKNSCTEGNCNILETFHSMCPWTQCAQTQ
jgi:RHS repeat-associated protein